MQHFLKFTSGTARAWIIPAQFFEEFRVAGQQRGNPRFTLLSDGKPLRRLLAIS
jgi:hypothetical protein